MDNVASLCSLCKDAIKKKNTRKGKRRSSEENFMSLAIADSAVNNFVFVPSFTWPYASDPRSHIQVRVTEAVVRTIT